ncbi:unnamed protein product [Mytilus coruscus]|uniref:CCHC-type domain-containing protein n=1 Tax=Mytilus coruscus TaxID=42192 RepID=A0A6J8BPU3_MYTCO|nr:unnamed protein product [Mytilus coruscus]
MTQTSSETVEQYITRLRQKAVFCNFHNIDENIRDQVIDKCYSQRLRRKVLKRNNVTLVQLREIAQSLEASEQRAVSMEQINKVGQHKFDKHSKFKTQNQTDFKQRRCFACGHEGHIKTDANCPARGKKCRKCKKEGHYEKCCKTKQTRNFNSRRGHATKFQKCFEGIGKLKNFQLKITIDESVKPVIQPIRRVPFHLREKLDKKLEELQGFDIIEKVDGPSTWVSPVVVIPKKNSEIRLCIDMRRANEAVVREQYPIPTVEEILQDLNQSRVYSKLDIKWAFHQIELSQESRDITAFMTHQGLFRYKRLMFGIIHGKSEEEHNRNLEQLLCRLLEKGLTLNINKCQFNMERIEFMGHILSEHGIGVSDSKVQAIKEARKPQTVTEVKSFMGLVNLILLGGLFQT